MKKFIAILLIYFVTTLNTTAADFSELPYKNISPKSRIYYDEATGHWATKSDKLNLYYTKVNIGEDIYKYINSDETLSFTTECEYEFIYNGSLIGFSNKDLKFYYISLDDNTVLKTELSADEVSDIFKNFQIIPISKFSKNTNAYKLNKTFSKLNVIVINDTDCCFDDYYFSSGNAKFKEFPIRGAVQILSTGMIQFSKNSTTDDSDDKPAHPWFVLLIRNSK